MNNNSFEINKEIELAKKYQVLSKYTSLYAEVENENSNPYLSNFEVVEQSNFEYIEQQNKNQEDEDEKEEKESSNDEKSESDENEESSNKSESQKDEEDITCGYARIKKKLKKKEDEDSSPNDSDPDDRCKKAKSIINKKSKKEKAKPKQDKKIPKPKFKENKMSYIPYYYSKERELSSTEFEDEMIKKFKKIKIHSKKEESEKEENNMKIEFDSNFGKINFNFKDVVLTQNIIEGNWYLNSMTEKLIQMNQKLYDKIKNYVEKYYQREDKEDIIITILVLYYLENNKNIVNGEYILIINKGLEYLESKGIKEITSDNIESYFGKEN